MGAGAMKAWSMRVLCGWVNCVLVVGRSIEARGQVYVKLCVQLRFQWPTIQACMHACVHTWAREAKSAASTRATRRRNRAILWQMMAVGGGGLQGCCWVGQSSVARSIGPHDGGGECVVLLLSEPEGSLRAIHHPINNQADRSIDPASPL